MFLARRIFSSNTVQIRSERLSTQHGLVARGARVGAAEDQPGRLCVSARQRVLLLPVSHLLSVLAMSILTWKL